MELRAVPKDVLPWAVPEVTVPQFVAPGYLAIPDGYPVTSPQGDRWSDYWVWNNARFGLGDALTIPLGIAAVVVIAGAMALGAWSGTLAREE
jgi:hypothetical protein